MLEAGIEEDDLIPLSALQHMLFCPRQCALIHVERLWAENVFTAEGRILHDRTDKPGAATKKGLRIVTGMPLRSFALGVTGVADVVEFHEDQGRWRPFPVEYKRGRPKAHRADEVQLCAQAVCLEEMLGETISEGALFYGRTRRRTTIVFDDDLRALTRRVAEETRALIASGRTPPPVHDKRCDSCSLEPLCRPEALQKPKSVARWLARRVED